MWVVCGYYIGKVYEEHAEQLKESLRVLNLSFDIQEISQQGNWYRNTQYKPTFLKMMLEKYAPDVNLVYVDVDAIFCRYPDYFDKLDKEPDVNIAVHLLDHGKRGRNNHPPEMLSGTIFLKNTETTERIVDEWIQECKQGNRLWDQRALAQVLRKYKYYLLPEEYTTIFDYMADVKNPVIKHFQASREERRKIVGVEIPRRDRKLISKPRIAIQNGQIRVKRMNPR